jgi:FMN phosphatase YigB (HAD superfamily)
MKQLQSLFEQSQLEQKYLQLLNNPAITIVSFDIFDTLLFRKYPKHSDVFEVIGEHPLPKSLFGSPSSFSQYRKNAEKIAYEKLQEGEEITLDTIYSIFPYSPSILQELISIELECECNAIVTNPQIDRWIDMAYQAGKKVILISDMYLSVSQLDKVGLSRLNSRSMISEIFVSNEHGLKKVTGNLFVHIQKKLEIEFCQQFHIGDHPRADDEVPSNLGIHTLRYAIEPTTAKSLYYESVYLHDPLHSGHHCRMITLLLNPYNDSKQRFYYSLGAAFFGPVLWEFSHWLAKIYHDQKLEQLNFLMREGDTFAHYFSKLYPNVSTNLIYASRQSTFLPSLDEDNINSLNFHLYKAFTIENFYTTYNLAINDPLIDEYKNVLCKNASSINVLNTDLLDYFMNDIYQRVKEIHGIAEKQKKLLLDYFSNLGVVPNSALIDFGGGGTALKRLNKILPPELSPKCQILFYQHAQGYKNLTAQPVLSFLPYTHTTMKAIENITRSYDFLEILLNATASTTTSYKMVHDHVQPIFPAPNSALEPIDHIIHAFRKGVDTFFSTANAYQMQPVTFTPEQLALILARIIDLPTPDEVDGLGELQYEEGEGSQHISAIIDNDKIAFAKEIGCETLFHNFKTNTMYQKTKLPWVQGVITKLSPNYLITIHGGALANPNQQTIEILLKQLDESNIAEIMVYGAGELFKGLLPYLHQRKIRVEAVIDSRAEVKSFTAEGYEVVSLPQAFKNKDKATIVIASAVFGDLIKQTIQKFAHTHKKTISILGNTL